MNMPKVSVIMPVYNVQQYLRQAVDSISQQTYSNWELILIDDGSTDGSGKLCDEYGMSDERIKVIHQENKGLSGARNTGIAVAEGKYLLFVDSDDYIAANTLEDTVAYAENTCADCVTFETVRFEEESNFCTPYSERTRNLNYDEQEAGCVLLDMLKREEYQPMACGYLLRTAILHEHDLEFRCGILHEDELFTLQAMLRCNKIVSLYEECYYYRIRENSITQSQDNRAQKGNSLLIIIQELLKLYEELEADRCKTEALDLRLEHLFLRAVTYYVQGDLRVRRQMSKCMKSSMENVKRLDRPWKNKENVKLLSARYNWIALKVTIKRCISKVEK